MDLPKMKMMIGSMKDLKNIFGTLTNKLNRETSESEDLDYYNDSDNVLMDEMLEITPPEDELNGSGIEEDYDMEEIKDVPQPEYELKEDIIRNKVEEILHQSANMMENFKYLTEHLKANAYPKENKGNDETMDEKVDETEIDDDENDSPNSSTD